MRKVRQDRLGIAPVISFLVALGIFLMIVAVVLPATQTSIPLENKKVDLQSKANQGLSVFCDGPGVGENGNDWLSNPDKIQRFGLTVAGSNVISSAKIMAMNDAFLEANPTNCRLDYEEVKIALGLQGYDFHIRTYPLFKNDEESKYGTFAMGDVKLAYIGDYEKEEETQTSMNESNAITQLGVNFTNKLYPNGDKFPDNNKNIEDYLLPRLNSSYYKILVVGSNAAQNSLSSNIKWSIEAWVKGGGNLVVMGGSKNSEWAQPFLSIGRRPAQGNAYIPDKNHPVLNTPNKLNAEQYPPTENAWIVPIATYSHIITKGLKPGANDYMEDLLAISLPGAVDKTGETIFGKGSVILTTFIGKELADALGFQEECKFFANLLMYAVNRNVYLDYGPTIPLGVDVAYSERLSVVDYPADVWGEMRFVFYVWQGT